MNEANLQRLIDHIESNKGDFNQNNVDSCIVGTAATLNGYTGNMTSRRKEHAAEFLSTTREQIDIFWDADRWPEPYKRRFSRVPSSEEVEVALDYLRSLVTGSDDVTHNFGGGLSFLETEDGDHVLVLKKNKATVSIPVNLAQIKKLHLLLGKIVWENS